MFSRLLIRGSPRLVVSDLIHGALFRRRLQTPAPSEEPLEMDAAFCSPLDLSAVHLPVASPQLEGRTSFFQFAENLQHGLQLAKGVGHSWMSLTDELSCCPFTSSCVIRGLECESIHGVHC